MVEIKRYPFDWKTPVGYVACLVIQIPSIFILVEVYVDILALFVGFCTFMTDFANDLSENLRKMNEDFNRVINGNSTIIERTDIKSNFMDIIQFHSDARE